MSYEQRPVFHTYIADVDLSARQFTAVSLKATDAARVIASTGSDRTIGMLMNAPAAGEEAEVVTGGGAKAKVDAAYVPGQMLKHDAAGKMTVCTAGDEAACMVIEPSAADGDIIAVMIVNRLA